MQAELRQLRWSDTTVVDDYNLTRREWPRQSAGGIDDGGDRWSRTVGFEQADRVVA